ncbi:putative sulfate exporter family transporter [Shewanella sp. Isolate11]|uniref:YeiH family protein n=1 Tax=Shewanella sp. Isolate11 TaxID=2908530 RepID=UPI001EFC5347|nr:putative sulfate exporter family transporter [Shewanella sp. Isolate11]MCG9697946.1 putative sulfate exporter family transporter [Shewanella sp. Isolate11]
MMRSVVKSFIDEPSKLIFIVCGLICLLPQISSPIALVLGFTLASLGLVPHSFDLNRLTKKLLAYSIVGLGFGIQLDSALQASADNLTLILGSIIFTLILGGILTKLLQLDVKLGHMISSGTAICGGSAIAAVSPAIKADSQQTAIALATVFVLNSIALFLFPALGHLLEMSQYHFGIWSAIAIHDTSSVVGAAAAYGDEALTVATTVKLARALWIIPLALISAMIFGGNRREIAIPYFILFYCVAIAIGHFLPQGDAAYELIFAIAKRTLVVCLFLIGAGITVSKMRQAGAKPMILGLLLWGAIGAGSLVFILNFS